jgi:RNA-directed DNA polymerase
VRKAVHSFDTIISVENLLSAWWVFKRGKTKKIDVQEFERNLMANLLTLHNELKHTTYRHSGYEHFVVSDPKQRDIHKASVRDRLVHHAIHRVLCPYFDAKFIQDSYSCRVGKGTHRALRQFETFARKVSENYTKQCWVLKCDIRKFFASIDHCILRVILEKQIADRDTLWLLSDVIQSFNSGEMGKGLPLGNLTSQLLVNIYMNEFDQYVKHDLKQKYYIRYADDFVFLARDREELETLRQKCAVFLPECLGLTLHPQKVFIKTLASGVDFLGWVHFPYHRVLRAVSRRRMFRRVYASNGRPAVIASYLGLLQQGNGYKLTQDILREI